MWGQLVNAMQDAAASRTLDQMHKDRAGYTGEVANAVRRYIENLGLTLISAALVRVDQGSFAHLDENNAFNSEGIRKLASLVAENRKERVRIETESEIAVRESRLVQAQRRLDIERADREAEIAQREHLARLAAQAEALSAETRAEAARKTETADLEKARDISAGLAVVFGMMRVINLAHGEFMMLGGYATITAVNLGVNVFVAMLIVAPVIVGLIGLVVERLVIRRLYGRLVDTMLATWGLSLFFIGGVIAAVAMLALPLLLGGTYTLTVLVIYGMLGLSLGLVWGFGGILCFGQAVFFGLGAYSYAICAVNAGESTLPMIAAVLVPSAFAAVLGVMMFYGRLGDVYLAIITLVVTLLLHRFMNSTAGPEYVIGEARLGGFNGIPGFQTLNIPGNPDAYVWGDDLYYVCFVALVVVYGLVTWLLRSSFGRIAVGIRENETRMSLMGYDVQARKTVLFTIGAAIAGLAGALFANWGEIVTPRLFSLGQSAEIIIWCIVGGLGTRMGPILGAAGLGYLKFMLDQQSVVDNTLITGLILVLFVLFLPRGIVPAIVDLWKASIVRRARRRPWRRRPLRAHG